MNKTLFEKLTCAGEPITVKQSVTDNIDRILNSGGFLDAVVDLNGDHSRAGLNGIYRNGLAFLVDQPAVNSAQLDQYRASLAKVLMRFEPRLKKVTVNSFCNQGLQSKCRLNIELVDGEFEQDFIFKQR